MTDTTDPQRKYIERDLGFELLIQDKSWQ